MKHLNRGIKTFLHNHTRSSAIDLGVAYIERDSCGNSIK